MQIGSRVFDRVTQHWATIENIIINDEGDEPLTIYILDPSVPDDPDFPHFPHRERLRSEISLTESPLSSWSN